MEISCEYGDLLEKRMLIKHLELILFKSFIIYCGIKSEDQRSRHLSELNLRSVQRWFVCRA